MDSALFSSVDEGLSFAESRTMEKARMRNLNIQRKLDLKISDIHNGWEVQMARISVEQRHLKGLLLDMKEARRGGLILPRGLSERHVQMIKDARDEAVVKSISLGEFDRKLTKFKDKRRAFRNTWQNYEYSGRGAGSGRSSDVAERCVSTNVHFNPYSKAEKDKSLIRQLQLLNIDVPSLLPARFYCEEEDTPRSSTDSPLPLVDPNDLQRNHTTYEASKASQSSPDLKNVIQYHSGLGKEDAHGMATVDIGEPTKDGANETNGVDDPESKTPKSNAMARGFTMV